MEPIATRLASFATNTSGFSNIPSRQPTVEELRQVARSCRQRRNHQSSYTTCSNSTKVNSTGGGSRDSPTQSALQHNVDNKNMKQNPHDHDSKNNTIDKKKDESQQKEHLARRILDLPHREKVCFTLQTIAVESGKGMLCAVAAGEESFGQQKKRKKRKILPFGP